MNQVTGSSISSSLVTVSAYPVDGMPLTGIPGRKTTLSPVFPTPGVNAPSGTRNARDNRYPLLPCGRSFPSGKSLRFYDKSEGTAKNSPDGNINLGRLTRGFVQAKNFYEKEFTETPPSFHKIRSLSGRMHKKEFGKDFAHRRLGHKSERMTAKYLESRKRNS